MQIDLISIHGVKEALFGLGLSHGLTSGVHPAIGAEADKMMPRLTSIARKLAGKGNGEDKFLRMITMTYDVQAPRYWWSEADTYSVGVVKQSESTMHGLHHIERFTQAHFAHKIPEPMLDSLNVLLEEYKTNRDSYTLVMLKNALPEGFLQRRIWMISMAAAINIVRQRWRHRLPEWQDACRRIVEDLPDFGLVAVHDAAAEIVRMQAAGKG